MKWVDKNILEYAEPDDVSCTGAGGISRVPVIFDSPHSGTHKPDDFDTACDDKKWQGLGDLYVDELFDNAPEKGAIFLKSLFPRTYIDLNRAADDIDPASLQSAWPGKLNPSNHCKNGKGLFWQFGWDQSKLYHRRLTVAQVKHRINRYWKPYWGKLLGGISKLHRDFGVVYHVNCHSMPSKGMKWHEDQGKPRPDFVLSNQDGQSCDPEFINVVAATLTRMGYKVQVNDPYKGGHIVQKIGKPQVGIHSLQIEINRRLYMNEAGLQKHSGFDKLKRDMDYLSEMVCLYAARKVMGAKPTGPSYRARNAGPHPQF